MTERTSPEERVFPVLLAGAVVGLLYLAGSFVMALVRGPNPVYVYVSGAAVLIMVAGIAETLRRWRSRACRRRRGS